MSAHALRGVRESDAPAAPAGAAFVRAKGAFVRTAEGRDYVDFDNGSGAVLLGHADDDIEAAVAAESRCAVRLRGPLAERLIALIPSAEDARFFACSADALDAARTAAHRATGRDRILYRRQAAVADDATEPPAAIVVDPLTVVAPCRRELAALRQFADRCGAVLIFDERHSALRVHQGGAQALYGVAADFTVVGEALGNGRPLAALTGRLDLMALVRGGQTTVEALAAGVAVLDKLGREPVLANLAIRGAEVQALLGQCIRAHAAQELVSVSGDPTAPTLTFADPRGRGLWLRELWARGVWSLGELYISYAHADREIGRLLAACDDAFEVLTNPALPPRRATPLLREVARR